jgi:hypothetical protein
MKEKEIKCLRCKKKIKQRKTKKGHLSLYCKQCAKETKMEIIE